jgi:hypothetical protein
MLSREDRRATPDSRPRVAHEAERPDSARRTAAGPDGWVLAPQAVLSLQRQAGNSAVSSLLDTPVGDGRPARRAFVQRDGPPDAGQSAGSATGGQPTVPVASIETNEGSFQNLSIPAAVVKLREAIDSSSGRLSQLQGEHVLLKQNRDDHWFIGGIVDVVGGATMPDLSIWAPVSDALESARNAADFNDPVAATAALKRAQDTFEAARSTYQSYKEAMEGGAESTIAGLEVVVKVCEITFVVAATVGTGGAAAGAEAAGAEAAGAEAAGAEASAAGSIPGAEAAQAAAIKTGAGMATDAAVEAAEKGSVDWQKLLAKGAQQFVAEFLGEITIGALFEDVAGPLEEALSERAAEEGLAATFGGEMLEDRIKLVLTKLTEGALGEGVKFAVEGLWESIAGAPESAEATDPHAAARKVGEDAGVRDKAWQALLEALGKGALTGASR